MVQAAPAGIRRPLPLLSRLCDLVSLTLMADQGFPAPAHLEAITALTSLQRLDMRGRKFMQVDADATLLGRQAWLHVGNEHLIVLSRCRRLTSLRLNHLHAAGGSQLAGALAVLTGLTELVLTDALSGHLVHANHMAAIASALTGLRSLEVGRVTCPPLQLMHEPSPVSALGQEGSPVACSFEPELLDGVASLPTLRTFSMELLDVPPHQCSGGGAAAATSDGGTVTGTVGTGPTSTGAAATPTGVGAAGQRPLGRLLRGLTLTACLLYDDHLAMIGRMHHLQTLRLDQVDVRTRDPDGWTALKGCRRLTSFSFRSWSNPVLSAGSLCPPLLTNDSLAMMAANWPRLETLSYMGKVVLTEKAEEHLMRMARITTADIVGPDGTTCRAWRAGSSGRCGYGCYSSYKCYGGGRVVAMLMLPCTAAGTGAAGNAGNGGAGAGCRVVSSRNGYVTYSDGDDSDDKSSEASVNWLGELGYVTSEYDAD
ncbi:hypothetical protein GPECTOR_87g396 [Gonium pectorale]|uniref:Uncharacterized protein n=1 Tax=Gonium pectorale TaxID=33097 RepID=A0A150G212_GONPE|nr:hypothetical protein GPECTOR_87g396 [Gonium pectorale]|eukprot:KXZ43535.1 hypothetical protein GPECTOR_87g396 [Gonium pectorale]